MIFLLRVLNKLKILKYFNFYSSIILNNKKFKIPVLQKIGFNNLFMSEPWMIDLLNSIVKIDRKGFVDIGVNVGQTLLKLKSVDETINYIGFEPNPSCVNYTKQLIELNQFPSCKLVPVGISNENKLGVLNFYSISGTDASASVIPDFRKNANIVSKEYVPLFDFEQIKESVDCKNFSILKIDVEGAEYEVLSSFYKAIEVNKPIILIEILPVYNNRNVNRLERQVKIQELLTKLNYSIFRVMKMDNIFEKIEEIEEIGIHADMNMCEYVMVPDSKIDKLKSLLKN